jgi:hypothetical protein
MRLSYGYLATIAEAAGTVTTPLMLFQDPSFTQLILVTLPETTPVNEASDLQDEPRRAGIDPFGWVINGCLSATAPTTPSPPTVHSSNTPTSPESRTSSPPVPGSPLGKRRVLSRR